MVNELSPNTHPTGPPASDKDTDHTTPTDTACPSPCSFSLLQKSAPHPKTLTWSCRSLPASIETAPTESTPPQAPSKICLVLNFMELEPYSHTLCCLTYLFHIKSICFFLIKLSLWSFNIVHKGQNFRCNKYETGHFHALPCGKRKQLYNLKTLDKNQPWVREQKNYKFWIPLGCRGFQSCLSLLLGLIQSSHC